MTRYPVATNGLPLVRWGPGAAAPQERGRARQPPRFADPPDRSRGRVAGISEVAAGLLLLVAWVLLWSFFLGAVVQPASRLLEVRPAEHPSLGVPAPANPPSQGAGPVSVDTDGGLP
ncbi:MAG TPA: hypothetical protein VMU15_12975 [Anaeromyxobacter sp.]|nr:hypothetical protein [Anaeromyxobacter sp.]